MRPLEITILKTLGCVALLFVVAAVFWPVFPGGYPLPKDATCLSNVKQQMTGMAIYEGDFNDRFPTRDAWMDATQPYVKSEQLRHCPLAPRGAYGYAFNGTLSNALVSKLRDPVSMPTIYDSVDPIRNASDLVKSLPSPGRHGRREESGRNNVGYADGHAKGVAVR